MLFRSEALAERGGQGRTRDFTLVHTPGVEAGAMFRARVTGHAKGKLTIAENAASRRIP